MSDLRHRLSNPPSQVGTVPAPESVAGLRCQWCAVPLADGVTVCPTCGSPGVADPEMIVAGVNDEPTPDPAEPAPAAGETPLPEWWNDDADGAPSLMQMMDVEDAERRKTRTLIVLGVAVLACAVFGWLVGPYLLVGPFERLTGNTVDNLGDLRGLGGMAGMFFGLILGAVGGTVIWASR